MSTPGHRPRSGPAPAPFGQRAPRQPDDWHGQTVPLLPIPQHLLAGRAEPASQTRRIPAQRAILAARSNGTGGEPRRHRRRRRRLRQTWWGRSLLGATAAVVLLMVVATGSMIPALTAPGTMSTTARVAEWARNHGMSSVVNWLEQQTYQAPKTGGAPPANSPLRQLGRHTPHSTGLPRPIAPLATPALPGEGQWRVVSTVHGKPALAVSFLRPDAVHTSYTAAAAWFNPRLVRAKLHPGSLQPGGSGWDVPSKITQPTGLLAAFNSGFKLADARGGFYQHGRYAAPLVPGAASMVFYTDGTMTVGQWGRDVSMSPKIAAVRQNLALIVDHGTVMPGINDNSQQRWGVTIGNDKYVWRSGVGVTATGDVVNMIGPGLSAHTLAVLLARAGCVRAMELDINPEWTSYVLYGSSAGPHNLLTTMQRSPGRYNSVSARDFVTLHAR